METLKRIRMVRGMNQVDLAKASGVSQNTISEIETGRREARAATLRKLASALEVEIADFFEEANYPKAQAPLPLDLDSADLGELRRAASAYWRQYGQLAGPAGRPVSAEDVGQLAEVGRKLDIINERMVELAPEPLATIVMHLGEPTQIFYHRDPTDEERTRLRAEYPDAVEVEAKQVALAY